MKHFYSITLVLAASIVRCTEAWILDSSCSAQAMDYQITIENGMRQAFTYNQAALDALTALRNHAHANDSITIAQRDLFKYLFSVAMKDGKIDPIYSKFEQLSSAFLRVKDFEIQSDGLPSPADGYEDSPDGLVVYCDWSRFDEGRSCSGKKDDSVACDRDLQQDIAMGPKFKECKTGPSDGKNENSTEPITYTIHGADQRYAQIQLCSAYIKKLHDHPLQSWTDIILKALLSKPKEVIQKIINGYDPIDIAAAGLGHTLFHDMIHAVGKGEIGDVHEDKPGAGGIDDDDGGVAAPYGWTHCLRYSPYGPSCDSMDKARALTNADNYAYFGLGASLISPIGSGKPQRVNQDGTLQVIPESDYQRGKIKVRALAMPAVPRGVESTHTTTTPVTVKLVTTTPITIKIDSTGLTAPAAKSKAESSQPSSVAHTTTPVSTTLVITGHTTTRPDSTGTPSPTISERTYTKHITSTPTDTPNSSTPTPSVTGIPVITPLYDVQDINGVFDFFGAAQAALSALEVNTALPVTGILPTPGATYTTQKTATTLTTTATQQDATTLTTTAIQKSTTISGQASITAPKPLCAPTGAPTGASSPISVPLHAVNKNITDFCSLEKSSMFGAARFDLPVPGSDNIRSYDQDYDVSNVKAHLLIVLVEGQYNITTDMCNGKMQEILNGCPPFNKDPNVRDLNKYGGSILVEGPQGTANFSISLEPHH